MSMEEYQERHILAVTGCGALLRKNGGSAVSALFSGCGDFPS